MSNVLLIEPNKVLGQTYRHALELAGHMVQTAATAQSAVQAADSFDVDVVVLELQLVQHSGAEFLYEFRSYADWQDVPVVVLSNVTPKELTKFVTTLKKQLNVGTFLYKPQTKLRDLVAAVNDTVATRV